MLVFLVTVQRQDTPEIPWCLAGRRAAERSWQASRDDAYLM
jgi:hypothetical protein